MSKFILFICQKRARIARTEGRREWMKIRDSRGVACMQDDTESRLSLPSCRGRKGFERTTCAEINHRHQSELNSLLTLKFQIINSENAHFDAA